MKRPELKLPRPRLPRLDPARLVPRRLPLPPGLARRFGRGAPPEEEQGGDRDDDADGVPAYLRPTFVQRNAALLAVVAAYLAFFAVVGGTVLYLVLNEKAILEAEKERRPSVVIERLQPEIVRRGDGAEESAPDGETTETAEAEDATPDAGQARTAADETGDAARDADADTGDPAEGGDRYAGLLTPHPDPALIEESPSGPLPRIGPDGRKPWRVYSRPYNKLTDRPRIAVVVSDVGIAEETTDQAIGLPGAVTLALAPYARNLADVVQRARDAGHEVLLTLPMEPNDYPRSDPGPYALLTSLDRAENMKRLEWVLGRATGYIGLASYQAGAFGNAPRLLSPVMKALSDRGLVYLETRPRDVGTALTAAGRAGAPHAAVDIVADADLTRATILRRLNEAEVLANAQGTAIVMIHPYPMAMARVQRWAESLDAEGPKLSPLSAVIEARMTGGAGG